MLSCICRGELRYITKAQDFEDCTDPTVYQALKEFFGLDGDEGNYIEKINGLEEDIYDLNTTAEVLRDEITELEDENDRLSKEMKNYEEMKEKVEKKIEEIKASSDYPHNFKGQMVEDFEWILKQLN